MGKFLKALGLGILATVGTLAVITTVGFLGSFYPGILAVLWVIVMIGISTFMFYED